MFTSLKHETVAKWVNIIIISLYTIRGLLQVTLTSSLCSPRNNVYIYYVIGIKSAPKQKWHTFHWYNTAFMIGMVTLSLFLLILKLISASYRKSSQRRYYSTLPKKYDVYIVRNDPNAHKKIKDVNGTEFGLKTKSKTVNESKKISGRPVKNRVNPQSSTSNDDFFNLQSLGSHSQPKYDEFPEKQNIKETSLDKVEEVSNIDLQKEFQNGSNTKSKWSHSLIHHHYSTEDFEYEIPWFLDSGK